MEVYNVYNRDNYKTMWMGQGVGVLFCATMFPTIVNNLTWTLLLALQLVLLSFIFLYKIWKKEIKVMSTQSHTRILRIPCKFIYSKATHFFCFSSLFSFLSLFFSSKTLFCHFENNDKRLSWPFSTSFNGFIRFRPHANKEVW